MNEFLQEKLEYITYRLDRLDRLAITDPHDLSVIDSLIFEKIHQFCDKEGVLPEMIRGNSELKDKLFVFLEESGTLRRMCREPKTLSESMERCLSRI